MGASVTIASFVDSQRGAVLRSLCLSMRVLLACVGASFVTSVARYHPGKAKVLAVQLARLGRVTSLN